MDIVVSGQTRALEKFVKGSKGSALLVGPPGTGKTALVTELLDKFETVVFDCSTMKMNANDSQQLGVHM